MLMQYYYERRMRMLRFLNPNSALMLLAVLFVSSNSLADPMYYTQYSGYSSANTYPFSSTNGQTVEWLFQPGDFSQPISITGLNQINAIYFFMIDGSTQTYTDLTIKMAQADITTLPDQFYSGTFETVYSSSSAILTGTNNSWLKITLDNLFTYDPTKSLIVSVEQDGTTASSSVMSIQQYYLSGNRRSYSYKGSPDCYNNSDSCIATFGIDIGAPVVPVPGAVLLGSLGLSLAGIRLRRKKI